VKKCKGILISSLAISALFLAACGGSGSSDRPEGINVNGQGTVYGVPDVVDVLIGVQVPAPNVAEARQEAATAMDALLRSVKGNGVPDADVRTSQFSVDPRFIYTPGGAPTADGYQVTNMVNVRIRKLDAVGKIVDEALAAGGNFTVIRTMAYSILDQARLQAEARELAVKDAKERADKLATLHGVKVGDLVQVNEGIVPMQPQPYYGLGVPVAPRTGGGDPTTLESGQLRVVVNVTANYEIDD
jgi:uncharacterized protein YggE